MIYQIRALKKTYFKFTFNITNASFIKFVFQNVRLRGVKGQDMHINSLLNEINLTFRMHKVRFTFTYFLMRQICCRNSINSAKYI